MGKDVPINKTMKDLNNACEIILGHKDFIIIYKTKENMPLVISSVEQNFVAKMLISIGQEILANQRQL